MPTDEEQSVDVDVEVDDGDADGNVEREEMEQVKKTAAAKPAGKKAKSARGRGKRAAKAAAKNPTKRSETKEAKSGDKKDSKERKEQDSYRHATGSLYSQPKALDVKIGGFTLSAYGKSLIQDTEIEFTIGRRYGLIGANGCGKSTFLRCLAEREVPIPDHIDIYFLDEEAPPEAKTALEVVVETKRAEMKRLEAEADRLMEEEGPDSELLPDIYNRLEGLDPSTFESNAGKLLFGLGFDNVMMAKHTKDMSGGWRMRVSLAKALFIKPSLLLLDEPTNHLDLEACVWLENYLATYPRCLVTVSHSQDFLNTVCTNIMHITPTLKLKNYTGNYDQFVTTKGEIETNQLKQYKKEQDFITETKKFISSCGTFANLVRQAKSRQKILDKMYARGLVEKPAPGPSYNFRFAACEPLPPPVLAFQNVAFSYDGKIQNALYRNVNLGVDMESRVAIVGPNGAGKTTLLKLMVTEISPIEGTIRRHTHVTMGRYHQHSNDQLDPEATPLEFMASTFPEKKYEEKEWRQQVGRFGISGSNQTAKIKTLSDGLKSRLVFSMMATTHPNVLLLDEPTNHLDMECIDALADAIHAFSGGVVLVSHDFRLLEKVAKHIWVVDKKSVTTWNGDIRSYKNNLKRKMAALE